MRSLILCLIVLLIPVAVAGDEAVTCNNDVSVAAANVPVGSALFPFAIDSVAMGGSCVFQCQQDYYECLLQPEGDPLACRAQRDDCFALC